MKDEHKTHLRDRGHRRRPEAWNELFYWQAAEYAQSAKSCERDCLTVLSTNLLPAVKSAEFCNCHEQANLCWAKSLTALCRAFFTED